MDRTGVSLSLALFKPSVQTDRQFSI